MIMASGELRHGDPEPSRNDKYGFDKYRWPAGPSWPRGLEIHIYGDGRVNVGGWHTSAVVLDVSTFRSGGSNASGHVIARFRPASDLHGPAGDAAVGLEPTEPDSDLASEPVQSADDDVLGDEDAYQRANWEAIAECKHLTPPYDPTAWVAMVRRWGAAEAARRMLISGDIQDGFRRLIAAGRHDLTVEWSALHPRWNRIFSTPHREAARWRTRQAGIEPPEDNQIS
jgi:hypothetical protein